ncbi:TrmH family RNA methyltransferase [Chthonobacter rhizosphaerae]|uniref:TrmH family RNA methyltransferase n=1 Tax=Chthonobacter rhizosphaerae TaxID=2735553 RepID=UPI0015EE915C|nr:RNA methyltransferase [Chthonobacter rhizosphaerae]
MIAPVFIDDPADPRVSAYMNVRDRDLAGAHGGLFVAEGETVLSVLLDSPLFAAESVLVAENRINGLAGRLEAALEVPVFVASQAVMDRIVGFPIHRGVLAVGRRGPDRDASSLLADRPDLVVGAVGIANHDNMGGLFRNAAAFGAGAVLLDDTACDPLYRKAIRVSVGGVLKVPFARAGDGADLIKLLREHGYLPIGLSPRGRLRLDEVDPATRPALILGTEGPGLPDDLLDRTETVRIDMAGGFDSLNVATTAGIALYELSRRRLSR